MNRPAETWSRRDLDQRFPLNGEVPPMPTQDLIPSESVHQFAGPSFRALILQRHDPGSAQLAQCQIANCRFGSCHLKKYEKISAPGS